MFHINGSVARLYCFIAILFAATTSGVNGSGGNGTPIRHNELLIRKNKGKEVNRYMVTSADPCVDFYEFACGKWSTFNKIQRENELLTAINLMEQRVSKELQDLLSAQVSGGDTRDNIKIKSFYTSCVRTETKTTNHRDFLLNFAKTYGGLPAFPQTNWKADYKWVYIIRLLREHYGFDILIGIDIDYDSGKKHIVSITEPRTTILPVELCSKIATTNMNVNDKAYESVQNEISRNMQEWLTMPETTANLFAGEIVSFEFHLCKEMRKEQSTDEDNEEEKEEEQRNNQDGHRRTTHGRGQKNHQDKRKQRFPLYDLDYYTTLFNNTIDFKMFVDGSLDMSINTEVFMNAEVYLRNLLNAIRQHSLMTVANYIMYRSLSELNFPSDDGPESRPRNCIKMMLKYFPKHLGDMYATKMFRHNLRTEAEAIFRLVRETFDDNKEHEWLEKNTWRSVQQKLSQYKLNFPTYEPQDLLQLQIPQHDYWRELQDVMMFTANETRNSIKTGEFISNEIHVEATDARIQVDAQDPKEPKLIIGWAMLQPPFYNSHYSNSIKYSTIGQYMARELMHILIDEQVQLRHSDERAYDELSDCMRAQYSNYLYNNPETYNNGSKLEELIADTAGLNIAFAAYLNWLNNTDASKRVLLRKETLPDVNFTNTQLFFITFAQARCTAKKTTDEPPPEYFPLDRHTEEHYAVNGPLSNSIEFALEFGCPIGSEMNPHDKCIFF